MVELVVKLPEGAVELLKTKGVDWLGAEHILCAVANGTPLPKGHGALKDEKDLITKVELNYRNSPKPIYVEAVKDMIRTTVSVIKPDDE